MKKKVYIETSIPSYLTSRPSQNLLAAAWQSLTVQWWEKRRQDFDVFTSELVLQEAKRGSKMASEKRLNVLAGIPLLRLTDDVEKLAKKLIESGAVPSKAIDDSLHIAIAAVHGMDYLLTWNCRHIDNAETKPLIRKAIVKEGYVCPEICTPQELLGGEVYEE